MYVSLSLNLQFHYTQNCKNLNCSWKQLNVEKTIKYRKNVLTLTR